MHLFASVASSTRQYLPLKNAGNIDVHLDIKVRICVRGCSLFPRAETVSVSLGSEGCCAADLVRGPGALAGVVRQKNLSPGFQSWCYTSIKQMIRKFGWDV